MIHKRALMARLWPVYSWTIDATNRNATLTKWLKQHASTIRRFDDKRSLFNWVHAEKLSGPIDYLEFGVYWGRTVQWWTEIDTHPDSRFVGFDSFEGLPEEWVHGTGSTARGHFAVDGVPHLDDLRARFVKGWFKNTLPPFLADFERRGQLVIHLDADLYSSTLFVLGTITPLLRRGDIIMFDDFAQPMDVFRAYSDWQAAWGVPCRTLASALDYHREIVMEVL